MDVCGTLDTVMPNTTESWLILLVTLAVAMWPVMVWLGMCWGRMEAVDTYKRVTRRNPDITQEQLARLMEAHANGRRG